MGHFKNTITVSCPHRVLPNAAPHCTPAFDVRAPHVSPTITMAAESEVEIMSTTMSTGQKRFYFNLKQNARGRFLKVSQLRQCT